MCLGSSGIVFKPINESLIGAESALMCWVGNVKYYATSPFYMNAYNVRNCH